MFWALYELNPPWCQLVGSCLEFHGSYVQLSMSCSFLGLVLACTHPKAQYVMKDGSKWVFNPLKDFRLDVLGVCAYLGDPPTILYIIYQVTRA